MTRFVGVVLAGGQGRRMGRTKGDLEVGGQGLARRAVSVLWPFCGTVLVSVGPGGVNPVPGCACVEDGPPAGRGPLAGLAAAFGASGSADLLVLACDYPQVDQALIRRLVTYAAEDTDDLILLTDRQGRDHPLVAIWSRRTEPVVRGALERGAFKVRGVLPDVRARRLRPEELPGIDLDRALLNLNWPADLERIG